MICCVLLQKTVCSRYDDVAKTPQLLGRSLARLPGFYAYLRVLHLGLSKSHFVRLSRRLTSFAYLLSHHP